MSKLTIKGLDQVQKLLDNIDNFQRWATPPMEQSVDALYERVKIYPRPRSGSKYVRTYTLQRSITKQVLKTSRGVFGHVFSTGANQGYGPYEHYVKVAEHQAEIHQGWWPTTDDDLEKERPDIERRFQQAAEEVLKTGRF